MSLFHNQHKTFFCQSTAEISEERLDSEVQQAEDFLMIFWLWVVNAKG